MQNIFMVNDLTDRLLQAVCVQLVKTSSKSRVQGATDYNRYETEGGYEMSTGDSRKHAVSCLKLLSSTIKDQNLEPNDLSKLMATVDFYLTQTHCFRNTKEYSSTPWPCPVDYINHVIQFVYFNHLIEVSLLSETNDGRETDTCFVVFSFVHDPIAYTIEEFQKTLIPTYDGKDENTEYTKLEKISNFICKIVRSFCHTIIKKKKKLSGKTEFFCTTAIEPLFSDSVPLKPELKKKKIDVQKVKVPPYYTILRDKFKNLSEKPTEAARLVAVLHDIILSNFDCTSNVRKDEWPGGAQYDGCIIPIFFKINDLKMENISGDPPLCVINLSVMSNQNEYYANFRFVDLYDRKCAKKIVKSVIPTFDETHAERDTEKIDNLRNWIGAVFDNFVLKVISGSYVSGSNTMFCSTSTTEPSSRDSIIDLSSSASSQN